MYFIIRSNRGAAGQVGMRHHASPVADFDWPLDHNVRTNINVGIDLGLRIDNGGMMNAHEVTKGCRACAISSRGAIRESFVIPAEAGIQVRRGFGEIFLRDEGGDGYRLPPV